MDNQNKRFHSLPFEHHTKPIWFIVKMAVENQRKHENLGPVREFIKKYYTGSFMFVRKWKIHIRIYVVSDSWAISKKIVCKICLINTTVKIKTLNNSNYLHICNHAVSQYIKKCLASLRDNNVITNIHSNALQQQKKQIIV